MRKDFLIFGSPLIEKDEIKEVVSTMRSGWLGTGPRASRFEQLFGGYKGSKHALALNSCTAALHLSILALGLKRGDEVITTAMTFCATVNSIIHAGAKPVIVDCQRDTMNIDPREIEKMITKKTKAILPVHFAGRPCDMAQIMKIAKKHGLKVIEDCAHAIESEYHGKKAGRIGDIGCFSFYVTKNIVTGEGGMAITDNEKYADRIKVLSLHGMSKDAWKRFGDKGFKHYQVVSAGFKYNMMDLQAAIGIHQIKRVEKYWEKRQRIWNKYDKAFAGLLCSTPLKQEKGTKHAYHLYTLLLDTERLDITRDEFLDELTKRNIGAGVHYLSINMHPYYQKALGLKLDDFPNAEYIAKRTISLPLSPKLNEKDTDDVIEAVTEILKQHKRK
jgi:dTDP-4-amino-4,6-dideoxygalactose transaminase